MGRPLSPVLTPSGITKRARLVGSVAALLVACGKARPVEAPVVDVAIATVDASARLVVTDSSLIDEPKGRALGNITGQWSGTGTQDDGQTWPMVVDITSSSRGMCAVADYPSIPCRGEWFCLSEQGGTVQARERLLDDSAQRCVDNGAMTVRVAADGMLEWTWSGAGQTAQARLRRAR